MIVVSATTRIFMYTGTTDMRKGFCGRSGLVKDHLKVDLFSGHLFVFFNRERDYVKVFSCLAFFVQCAKTQTWTHQRNKTTSKA